MSSITEHEFLELKREVEDAKAQAERARGALEQSMQNLKEAFGVSSLKEAKQKLAALETEAEAAEAAFTKAFKAYQKKWGDND